MQMLHFTVYSKETGQLGAQRAAPADELDHYVDAQLGYVLGHWETTEWEVDLETFEVVPRNVPLEEQQETLWKQVKQLRQRKELNGADTEFGRVQTDKESLERMRIVAACGSPIEWLMADNSKVPLAPEQMGQLITAVSMHWVRCHDRAQELRAQIFAPDPDLSVIDIADGWPS